jgi:3-methyladenine DNA glycosylase/8-oxoguanine DNA glycosylase
MRKALLHLKNSDSVMRSLIEQVGPCRMRFGEPTFHSLAEAIIYQQLNGKAAETIFKRFLALAGEPLTPDSILRLSPDELRTAGLSQQKATYLRDLAEKTRISALDFSRLAELSDEEVIERLTQVKGVGVWTAQMFLMFSLRRPNVLPTGDFGIRMAIHKHYLNTLRRSAKAAGKQGRQQRLRLPGPEQMKRIAKPWEPYRSLACWYLWQSLEMKTIG